MLPTLENQFELTPPRLHTEFTPQLHNQQEMEALQALQTQLAALAVTVENLVKKNEEPKIEEHKDLTVTVSVPKDVSLEIYKTLPEFNGEREKYSTWRSTAITAIGLLKNHPTSMRFFEALMIIRNKITGPASNILNNYNTAFNFDAIIDRLDSTYADKRPLYILEQELMVLQQNKLTVDAFYDLVNEKLNAIVNKINMSYKEKQTAKSFVESANEKALRTFITGLNNKRGEILYASNPSTLPEAYARLQTIVNDQERISFASRYNFKAEGMRNPQFRPTQQQNRNFATENWSNKPSNQQNWREKTEFSQNNEKPSAEAMEVDRTSTAVNVEKNQSSRKFANPFKRDFSKSNSRPSFDQMKKVQRLNNVEDEAAFTRTILHDEHAELDFDDEFADQSNDYPDETSSIFLGN